jgi:hypothetical protein
MHHFVFCQKDTFIYSEETARQKNFGLDKFVEVAATNTLSRTYRTSSMVASQTERQLINRYVQNFNGDFSGSICDGSGEVSGSIVCNSTLAPGGSCRPTYVLDEFGNVVIDDNGNVIYLSSDEDFFVFP